MEDVDYLVISVKKCYLVNGKPNKDFETVSIFFDTLYSSKKFTLPLKGILIIGY